DAGRADHRTRPGRCRTRRGLTRPALRPMSEAWDTLSDMEAPLVAVLIVIALAAGIAAGWFASAGRSAARVAALEAELAAVRDDRDRQYDLYRDAVEHARSAQRAEAERAQQ